MSITHTFVSAKADDPDNTLIRPSNWNATHTIGADTIGDNEIAAHTTTKITVPTTKVSGELTDGSTTTLHSHSGSTPAVDYESIDGTWTTQPWEEIVQGGGLQITEVAGNNAIRIDAEFDMHFLLMGG